METSKPVLNCQRPREWWKPGLFTRLKILPEPRIERQHPPLVSRRAGVVPRYTGRESPQGYDACALSTEAPAAAGTGVVPREMKRSRPW